jgi:hypothetical protein
MVPVVNDCGELWVGVISGNQKLPETFLFNILLYCEPKMNFPTIKPVSASLRALSYI